MLTRRTLLAGVVAPAFLPLLGNRAASAVGVGTYEDTNPALVYAGTWLLWPDSPGSSGGTFKFSNVADSSVSLTFLGSSLTLVHSKQTNAGIATVKMDGTVIDNLDCYLPSQLLQQSKTYVVPRGEHTVTVMVSGAKSPSATDCYVILDAFVVSDSPLPAAGRRIQTNLDIFGPDPRATEALVNYTPDWSWPADAFSASGRMFRCDKGLAALVFARWVLVWNPMGPETGVRLTQFGYAPGESLTEIARLEGNPAVTPVAPSVDITAQMNALVVAGTMRWISHQQKGPGAIIFHSTIEMVWDLS